MNLLTISDYVGSYISPNDQLEHCTLGWGPRG